MTLPVLISLGALLASVIFGIANLRKSSDKELVDKIDRINTKLDNLTGSLADTDKQVAVLTYRVDVLERSDK